KPTGSGDAFGLRRAALGIIRIILENDLRLPLRDESGDGLMRDAFGRHAGSDHFEALREVVAGDTSHEESIAASARFGAGVDQERFLIDRFIVQQRDAGVPAEVVRAILPALTTVDLVDMMARIAALRAFLDTEDGRQLMAGYKRATNILRIEEGKDGPYEPWQNITSTAPEDTRLKTAIEAADEAVEKSVTNEDYVGAMEALAALRAPVDAFFEAVIVNADDAAVRRDRLHLLASLRGVSQKVAEFSELPG
ncbi:MAG: glycine--tRNA ligase subunit beta, partial [Pseudomonadota bacterium]